MSVLCSGVGLRINLLLIEQSMYPAQLSCHCTKALLLSYIQHPEHYPEVHLGQDVLTGFGGWSGTLLTQVRLVVWQGIFLPDRL